VGLTASSGAYAVGDFVYTDAEHHTMLEQIQRTKDAGAQGIVTGALTDTHQIAETLTAELLDDARPLPVTFHRAFDVCVDLAAALERCRSRADVGWGADGARRRGADSPAHDSGAGADWDSGRWGDRRG